MTRKVSDKLLVENILKGEMHLMQSILPEPITLWAIKCENSFYELQLK
jgi:hypothetical protein